MLNKTDIVNFKWSEGNYEVVGKWLGDYVFSPVNEDDDQCLVYSEGDIKEFYETGKIVIYAF
jgi:hypothetical protein